MRFLLIRESKGVLLFGLIMVAAIFLAALKEPFDPDLFWHIRAGKEILQNGIPHIDWFSHTFSEFPWVNHEYAQDVLIGWLHSLGGFRLLAIFYTAVVTAIATVGLKWSLPQKVGWPWVLVIGFFFVLLSHGFIGARPQMITYLFILLELGLLMRFRQTQKVRWLWFMPFLFIIWANLHGSFIAGLVILFAVLTAEAIKIVVNNRIKIGRIISIKSAGVLSLMVLTSVVATFINPYFHGVWVEALRTLTDSQLHNNIVEWFAPNIYNPNGFVLVVITVLLLPALALRHKLADLSDVAPLMIFLFAAFTSVRNLPLLLLLGIPVIVLSLREINPRMIQIATRVWPALATLVFLIIIGARLVPLKTIWNIDSDNTLFSGGRYPVAAAEFLRDNPEYATKKAFNIYAWGGYLLLEVPDFKTFIDGRMPSWEHNGVRIINDYFVIDRAEPEWRDMVDKYNTELFIMRPDHALVSTLEHLPEYREVFRDDTAVIFVEE